MTPSDVAAIVRERLQDWGDDAIRDHATPVLMVAVGHDHASGELHVYVPDSDLFDRRTIRGFLRAALRELQ